MKNNNLKYETIDYMPHLNWSVNLCQIKYGIPHCHPSDLELMLCLDGHGELISGEELFSLSPGSLFSINFDENHFVRSNNEVTLLVLHINLLDVPFDWNELKYRMFTCESSHCFPYQSDQMSKIKDSILALAYSFFENKIHYDKSQSVVKDIVQILMDYFDWFNYNNQDEYINPDLRDRFYRSVKYCMDNFSTKITASDLSSREHINSNYFSQFLANTVFNSFSHMIKYVRCFKAEHLLLETNMPNYEIAYAVGFSDPKYFYAAFDYWWKCSPKEHRLKYQNQFRLNANTKESYLNISGERATSIIEKSIRKWHLIKVYDLSKD